MAALAIACVYGLESPEALEPARSGLSPPAPEAAAPRKEAVSVESYDITRTTEQPGSVCAFEAVDLHSMVSGYLKTQNVDIGSRIEKGQVLAVVDVPRVESLAAEAAALLDQAQAQALQAETRVKAAEADRDVAAANAEQRAADVDRLVAQRKLAEAQYKRIKQLSDERAIDMKVVDERLSGFESARAAENAGRLAAKASASQLAAANVRIEQARADVAAARAAIAVAEARLQKSRVDLDYSKIVAPFDGVVTRRNFHPGAFIASQSGTSQQPLLAVSRTDWMRVVVQVPDRDVIFVNPGDPAVLRVDGLENRNFEGKVSRVAEFEDVKTRTMRVEIDLPNPDGILRDGMYAKVTIRLEANAKKLMIPLTGVQGRTPKGRGYVHVVRNGVVTRADVTLGSQEGQGVEVLTGLKAGEKIVVESADVAVGAKAAAPPSPATTP